MELVTSDQIQDKTVYVSLLSDRKEKDVNPSFSNEQIVAVTETFIFVKTTTLEEGKLYCCFPFTNGIFLFLSVTEGLVNTH